MRIGLRALGHAFSQRSRSISHNAPKRLSSPSSSSPCSSSSSSHDDVETVFSHLVATKVSEGPVRDALVELKRSLNSVKDSWQEIDTVLSRNASSILHQPRQWILLLELLRSSARPSLAIKVCFSHDISLWFYPHMYTYIYVCIGRRYPAYQVISF